MNDLNLIDPELSRSVRQRRAELWDACIARFEAWASRLIDLDWSADPDLSYDELYEELHFGRG